MDISFTCPCGEPLNAAATDAGQEVRCPKCGTALQVPAGETLGYVAPATAMPMVTGRMVDMIRQTILWVRIMSILMFVGSGFMLLAGAALVLMGVSRRAGEGLVGCIYIPFACLYIVPAIFLWRYATHSKSFTTYRHEASLEEALQAQKSFWKFTAIAALVIIGLYIVMIPLLILASIR